MLSINLWNKATEIGSKLKDTLQISGSDKPLIEKDIYDKLKEEYDQLKKDFDEKTKKYDLVMQEINNKKEKEENLSENDYKEFLNNITNKFKTYIINLFGDKNNSNIEEEINLLFINTHKEDFDSKVNEYNKKKFENILINNLISNNKEIIEDLIQCKYNNNEENKEEKEEKEEKEKEDKKEEKDDNEEKEEKDDNEEKEEKDDNEDKEEKVENEQKKEHNEEVKNEKENKEEKKEIKENKNIINLNKINSTDDIGKILLKLQKNKNSMETKIDELQTKLTNNIQRFQLFQQNIEKFQKDYKEIKNDENSLKEIINQKEKDIIEKETKINELKSLIEQNKNEIKEKDINISGYKTNIDQLNIKIKEQSELLSLLEKNKIIYEEEIQSLNTKIKNYKDDMDLLQVNSDEINNKNIQITELMRNVESLKSSYKLLEESKIEFAKEKNEEIDIYKNQILELTQQLNETNEKIQNVKKNEEIENIYIQKISELEKQNINYEKSFMDMKKENDDMKKELQEVKNKMIKELRDNEFMIDKRVISSVLVSYFDVNASDLTKKNLLETLSSIMEYSNEDREKMGLKAIHIGDKNDKNSGKLKSISDGLYDFILNS